MNVRREGVLYFRMKAGMVAHVHQVGFFCPDASGGLQSFGDALVRGVRLGAEALVLLPSVMLLHGGAVQAAKREWRPVLRAAGKRSVFVSLADPVLNGEETLSGVRAANKAGAAGVVVRGEVAIVSAAFREACPVCTQGVGSAEELSLLCTAGAGYAFTAQAECLAGELRQLTKESDG